MASSKIESAQALEPEMPDGPRIERLLRQYAPVRLTAPAADLAAPDLAALASLVEAGRWIDRIFWKQHSPAGAWLADAVLDDERRWSPDFRRLLRLNFGPWNGFDGNRPFWGEAPRPSGGSLYPARLNRAQLESYLDHHPAERAALLSHTTLIEERAGDLYAVPYTRVYREELSQIRRCLLAASETATDDGFRRFLRARAEGLCTGALLDSELLWVSLVRGSPIDVAIGPYEVYDDDRLGLKAAYESTVLVRHSTRTADQLEAIAAEVERLLPGAMTSANARQRMMVGVYDVVHAAGLTNMGSKAVAATLPNDEEVRARVGARLLLFRNVIAAKFQPIIKPLASRVLRRDQLDHVREDAFLEHTLLHEMAHALGTCFVWRNGVPTSTTINTALGERYSTIDECRADLIGMVYLDLLTQRGVFAPEMRVAAAVTFVVNLMRSLRFGVGDAYSKAGAITLSHLLKRGALKLDSDGRLAVDPDATHRGVHELAARVQAIATGGNYSGAGALIGELTDLTPATTRLLNQFDGIPIDVEFIFDELGGL